MSDNDDQEHSLANFDRTVLLKIKPGKSTLPIETAAEWTKGFMLVNKVISELLGDTFVEKYTDETGNERSQTHIHPQLLPFIQERRRLQDQIWKLLGGEAVVEGKKQAMKNLADMIFHLGKDAKNREANKQKIKEIIEVELEDEFNGSES